MRSNSIKNNAISVKKTVKTSCETIPRGDQKNHTQEINNKKKMQRQKNSILQAFPVKFIKIKGEQVVPLKS